MSSKAIFCNFCHKRTPPKLRFSINSENGKIITCNKCRLEFKKHQNFEYRRQKNDQIKVQLNLNSISATHSMCFICQSKTNQKIVCNQSLITQIFINEGIVIPNGNRICKDHLTGAEYLDGDSIAILKLKANEKSTRLNPKNIVKLLNDLRSKAKSGITSGKLNFDESSLSNEDYYNLTGIYKDQFDYLLSFINVTGYKYPRCALGAFMLKLRCGLSLSKIGSIIAFYNKKKLFKQHY